MFAPIQHVSARRLVVNISTQFKVFLLCFIVFIIRGFFVVVIVESVQDLNVLLYIIYFRIFKMVMLIVMIVMPMVTLMLMVT